MELSPSRYRRESRRSITQADILPPALMFQCHSRRHSRQRAVTIPATLRTRTARLPPPLVVIAETEPGAQRHVHREAANGDTRAAPSSRYVPSCSAAVGLPSIHARRSHTVCWRDGQTRRYRRARTERHFGTVLTSFGLYTRLRGAHTGAFAKRARTRVEIGSYQSFRSDRRFRCAVCRLFTHQY